MWGMGRKGLLWRAGRVLSSRSHGSRCRSSRSFRRTPMRPTPADQGHSAQSASSSAPSRDGHQNGVCSATACSSCAFVFLSSVQQRDRRFEPPVAFLAWRRVDQAAPKASEYSYFRARSSADYLTSRFLRLLKPPRDEAQRSRPRVTRSTLLNTHSKRCEADLPRRLPLVDYVLYPLQEAP